MSKSDVCARTTELVLPILDSMGIELVDLEFGRAGRDGVLRLFIDKPGGITLDDCADVSSELSLILDVEDFIPGHYSLEVSSPGLDRPLKKPADYEQFTGRLIKIKTFEPLPDEAGNRRKTFLGHLDGLVDGVVRIRLVEGQNAAIPLDRVAKANLEFEM